MSKRKVIFSLCQPRDKVALSDVTNSLWTNSDIIAVA